MLNLARFFFFNYFFLVCKGITPIIQTNSLLEEKFEGIQCGIRRRLRRRIDHELTTWKKDKPRIAKVLIKAKKKNRKKNEYKKTKTKNGNQAKKKSFSIQHHREHNCFMHGHVNITGTYRSAYTLIKDNTLNMKRSLQIKCWKQSKHVTATTKQTNKTKQNKRQTNK